MNKVRVIGATVSKDGVTLYLENGSQHALRKDSYQTKKILDEITAELARHKVVEIDLESLSIEKAIEQQSGGFIRFVREKLVDKVTQLFRPGRTVEKVTKTWVPHEDQETSALARAANHATVADHTNVATVAPTERVVAVVGTQRVEGVEAIARHAERAAYGEGFVGFKRFLERMAAVAPHRKHQVEELLNFMRRADLPIADDGSIIAYKVLRKNSGRYVDCHTQKVSQALGSRVSMDEKLVDDSRRTECSTGLHIARRGYLSSFGGDVVTLVKIAPEDVIAVPFDEPNKMRVAAYHILFEISPEGYSLLKSHRPMTQIDADARKLGDAIAGRHSPVLEEVVIGGPHGTNVAIRKVGKAENEPVTPNLETSKPAAALDDASSVVDAREIRKTVDQVERDMRAEAEAEPDVEDEFEDEDDVEEAPVEVTPEPVPMPAQEVIEKPKRAATVVKAPTKTEPRPKQPKPKAAKTKPVTSKPAKVAAISAPNTVKSETDLSSVYQSVLTMHDKGESFRSIEAELHVCRKTISKLVKTYRTPAAPAKS